MIAYISIFCFLFLFYFLLHSIKTYAGDIKITRKENILIAKGKGIKDAHKMSTDTLIKVLHAKKHLFRKDYNAIAEKRAFTEPQKMSTSDLLNALSRYDSRRKSYAICRKLRKVGLNKYIKKQNISENDLRNVTKLQNMSLDGLKKIAILRGINNYDVLTKEDLIYTLLRPEKNLLEGNFIKYIGNNTDDEIRAKINNIKIVLARLGNIITKKDRENIRKELYDIEKKKRLTKPQRKKNINRLIRIANTLDKKQEYKHSDYDDQDYFGIKDIENLFDHINNDDYYQTILVKRSFKSIYECCEIRGDRDKKLSIKQYFYMIMPPLTKLIDERKNSNKNEQKVQLSMGVNFINKIKY